MEMGSSDDESFTARKSRHATKSTTRGRFDGSEAGAAV